MATAREMKEKTLATIDGALCVLDKLPKLDPTNIDISFNASVNPFELLLDMLKRTRGYDGMINILSKIIGWSVDALEPIVKGLIISNLKSYFTCSINPIIPDRLLEEGFVFDLKKIDVNGIMNYSPISSKAKFPYYYKNPGEFMYFGCEGFNTTDELINATDFDAFLWYVKNCTNSREVWLGVDQLNEIREDSDNKSRPNSTFTKQQKSDGIVTLEYNGRSSGLTKANGQAYDIQVPFNNCVHLFIGNVKSVSTSMVQEAYSPIPLIRENISKLHMIIDDAKYFIDVIEDVLASLKENKNLTAEELKQLEIFCKTDITNLRTLIKAMKGSRRDDAPTVQDLMGDILVIDGETQVLLPLQSIDGELAIPASLVNTSIKEQERELKNEIGLRAESVQTNNGAYRPIDMNYYYRKPLFQFNYDYVMSLKIFDKKVVTAQLVDALTQCFTVNMSLSYEEALIRAEVERMVNDIVESDDTYVNDCFFSFTNDTYNDMLETTQMNHMGIHTDSNGNGRVIDYDSIMDALNQVSEAATENDMSTAIEGALNVASASLLSTEETAERDFKGDITLIESFMTNLAAVLVRALISPKLYMLMAVNMRVMGDANPNFDVGNFIRMNKNMMVSLIRSIRDELITLIMNEVMATLKDVAESLMAKLTVEQFQYYKNLLASCIECFRLFGTGISDWNMDNVDYADIYETDEPEPQPNNC
jgi:hypothetical protein